ncbi:hypothetical protein AB4077_18410 [Vibrio cyclitrophicus]|uniref:hypothetical protein n=1 Tax=Vibrio cyclitrophicus TaxID=47951 RepID=UPI000319B18B|nr:hypothetical protein [Vibrio cyclitrophicus]MBU2932205.1 hypothetical protein [Vibrio cyclitrophicus]MCC4773929.1 hypothetical protein [Vibrio cyclitrophicus]MCC4840485.1 hypothetical protein [Vibrio cyclitrophicus]OEF37182.1 hypothetical protein OA7_03760 [Vibrio cyclitrophicus 1F53]OEF38103.1 hypothetical protein OAE_09900 [Vibrio cyclitrophicus 1F289]
MSEIKQKLSVSVFESLLKPSTDYLGTELKGYFQHRIEGAKAKREEQNLLSHIESVRKKSVSKQETELSYSQLELFEQWAGEVEKIDPSDETLSDIWHNLLLNSEDSFNSEVLLTKLKKLSSGDAITLIKVLNRNSLSREDRYRLTTLKALGLVEQNELKTGLIQFLFMAITFLALLSTVVLLFSPPEVLASLSKPVSKTIAFLPMIASGLSAIGIIKYLKAGNGKRFNIWRLTWLGDRLVSLRKKERL